MKFILDAQLPKKLSIFLRQQGYDALHTLDLPDKNKTKDTTINQISLNEKKVLISKDFDFIQSVFLSDKPYKLIYVLTRNITNKKLFSIFEKNLDLIIKSIKHNRVIEITSTNIIIR